MFDTQITLTGRVGGDVTLRAVGHDRQVATFRMACTPSRFRDGEWTRGATTWHTVTAWNRLARHVAESLCSGDPVVVHGRLVADVWEREGKQQTSYQVVASAVGHDLAHGTSTFVRQPAAEPTAETTAEPTAEPTAETAAEPAVEPAVETAGRAA